MLVLSRKPDERIFIGDDIVITVISVRGAKVRLGIEAPDHVLVMREELLAGDRRKEARGQRTEDTSQASESLASDAPASGKESGDASG